MTSPELDSDDGFWGKEFEEFLPERTKERFHKFLTEQDIRRVEEAAIFETNAYSKGAWAVLEVLRKNVGSWVPLDALMAASGQRAVHSRIAELRNKFHFDIESNRRGGAKSAYRLVKL